MAIVLSGGGTLSQNPCKKCEKLFVWYPDKYPHYANAPHHCATCTDERQNRPSVVIERMVVRTFPAMTIESLPTSGWEMREGNPGDVHDYRIKVLGRHFGSVWSGRIDLRAPEPYKVGDVVTLREMKATHRVRKVLRSRQRMDGSMMHWDETIPLQSEEGTESIETRWYLVLEKTDTTPEYGTRLSWSTAYSKTTLKGLGAQFVSKHVGEPIAVWTCHGGCRSGRFETVGALAVIDNDHPYQVKTWDL